MLKGKGFDELKAGEKFSDSVTVTETHIVMACGIFKDFNSLHSNESLAQGTTFKGRIAHGPLTAGIMGGVLGNYFCDTAFAYLEQTTRFKAPVVPGDTLTTEWEVVNLEAKAKYDGGIVSLRGNCRNQHGVLVAEAEGKIIVINRK
jgi:3-hydroxybutyryl-CoA dehydratase